MASVLEKLRAKREAEKVITPPVELAPKIQKEKPKGFKELLFEALVKDEEILTASDIKKLKETSGDKFEVVIAHLSDFSDKFERLSKPASGRGVVKGEKVEKEIVPFDGSKSEYSKSEVAGFMGVSPQAISNKIGKGLIQLVGTKIPLAEVKKLVQLKNSDIAIK